MGVLRRVTAAETLPLELSEVKAALRISHEAEDTLIAAYLQFATEYLEELCGPFLTQTWEQYEDSWPAGSVLALGKPFVQGIEGFNYTLSDGSTLEMEEDAYYLDLSDPYKPRLVLNSGYSWPSYDLHPARPIQIIFTAGYGDDGDDVPGPLKLALLLLVAHFYEERQPVSAGITLTAVPVYSVDALIANYRRW
jgi:uncharacterized phiE125 gp8 family phage protein